MKVLLLIAVTLCAGCLFSSYGYRHSITYSTRDEVARAELPRKVEEQSILQGIPGAHWSKGEDVVSVTLVCETKQMTSPEVGELRRQLEAAIGAELLKKLKASKSWNPIP
jgi:hypothetical protein